MEGKQVTVFSGAEFLGRTIVYELARRGRVLRRMPRRGAREVSEDHGEWSVVRLSRPDVTNAGLRIARAARTPTVIFLDLASFFETEWQHTFDASSRPNGPLSSPARRRGCRRDPLVHVSASAPTPGDVKLRQIQGIQRSVSRRRFRLRRFCVPASFSVPTTASSTNSPRWPAIVPFPPADRQAMQFRQPVFVQEMSRGRRSRRWKTAMR